MMPYMSLCVVMIDLGNLRDQIFPRTGFAPRVSLVGTPWSLFLPWVARDKRLTVPARAAAQRSPAPASDAASFAHRLVRSNENVRLGMPECGPQGGCRASGGAAGGSAGLPKISRRSAPPLPPPLPWPQPQP